MSVELYIAAYGVVGLAVAVWVERLTDADMSDMACMVILIWPVFVLTHGIAAFVRLFSGKPRRR